MRRYEQIYILRPSLGEDEINSVVENTNQIILSESGSIISNDKWGMKKLAYPIKKELQGYYVFCDFASTPAAVSEMERKFRIDDSVLKYMTVKISDAITAEGISAAQAEAESKAQIFEDETESAETQTEPTDSEKTKDAPPVQADTVEDSK
ncbi:MAG: 30S ribosomal protein S6 [Deltaproteobacteria bacterium]|nr:30S ribosomal protein S6 [Deltaproteobacteria bacterium]